MNKIYLDEITKIHQLAFELSDIEARNLYCLFRLTYEEYLWNDNDCRDYVFFDEFIDNYPAY